MHDTTKHDDVAPVPAWRDTALDPATRARSLLAALTVAEKASQIGSVWLTDQADDFAPASAASAGSDITRRDLHDGVGQLTRAFGTDPLRVPEAVERLRTVQARIVASNRLGIPALVHEECLTGVAAYGATAFATPLAWAATFDEAIVRELGERIGSDLRALGVHQGLSPVLDVVKDYRWGRVEETLGEDPYLVGLLGAAYVAGLESRGVIATLKHFAGYAGSRSARNHGPVGIGPRELADTVLPPFETALRLGGARSVMNSYADLDGVPAALHHDLLGATLRDEWGFDGTVVSDYWTIPFLATAHRVAPDVTTAGTLALAAGIDVELPETVGYGPALAEAIRSGAVDESLLDRAVLRHLRAKVEAGLLDPAPPVPDGAETTDLDSPVHRDLARRLAERSLVLLQGRETVVAGAQRVAVLGPCADEVRSLMGCYAFPNHVLTHHPGLELGIPVRTVLEAVRAEFPDATVTWERGCEIGTPDVDLQAARAAAAEADVAVVVVGDVSGLFGTGTSGEGCDVGDLRLPGGQHALVEAVLGTGTPTVLVVLSGRPYALGDYGSAATILQAFAPGVEGASAIAGALSGRVRPTGRLPVQVPRHPDAAGTYLQPALGGYNPGISVLDPRPLFPFGFGLVPGDVRYTGLTASGTLTTDGCVRAEVTVTNASDEPTAEVVQLYLTDPVATVARPLVQLLAFARVELAGGESVAVTFDVDATRLSYTGSAGTRVVDPGEYVLSAGPDAGHRPVRASFELGGETHRVASGRSLRSAWTVHRVPGDHGAGLLR